MTRDTRGRRGWGAGLALLLLALASGASARAGAYDEALADLFARAGRDAVPAQGDATLRDALLGGPPFVHEAVGPFDLYVLEQDALDSSRESKKVLEAAVEGLAPAADVVAALFAREQGLVSGRRFPIVLAESDRDEGERGFDAVVALLHLCESFPGGYVQDTGPIWTAPNLAQAAVRTWDALAINLGHPQARAQGKAYLAHGIGYEAITLVCQRLLRLGAWGNVPPWLAQGLIDELDIRAYEQAWLGDDLLVEWAKGGSSWQSTGWSGFLPTGKAPPPPARTEYRDQSQGRVTGGGSWADRTASETRHWKQLRADMEGEAPVSLAEMARYETFLDRDRAYARFVVHLLLLAGGEAPGGLLERLDHETPPTEHGMKGMDPLPALVARALGGLPEVDALEALPARELLASIGREALAQRIEALGAREVLALDDHRAMGRWLYESWEIPAHRRQELFEAILEVEYYQQEAEWARIDAVLDRAARHVLASVKAFPKSERERDAAAEAFAEGLTAPAPEG